MMQLIPSRRNAPLILLMWLSCSLVGHALFCEGIADPPESLNLSHETSFVVYPSDCNAMGTLFGGKTMSEMDRTAGVAVRRFLYASKDAKAAVTSRASVKFIRPAKVKDLLFVRAKIASASASTVEVNLTVEREIVDGKVDPIASGVFTFVAVDPATGKPTNHGIVFPRKE